MGWSPVGDRWAVLADVHANFHALDAVLADARTSGVDEVLFLGDAVGYGPEPHRCLARLQAEVSDGAWVLGNHDEALGLLWGGAPEGPSRMVQLKIGTREENWIALRKNYELLRHTPERLEHLATRETEVRIGTRVSMVHGGHRLGEPTVTYTEIAVEARDEFMVLGRTEPGVEVLLVGHTHRAVAFRQAAVGEDAFEEVDIEPSVGVELEDRRWVLNPGSVGQPRDGDRRASYMILDLGRNLVELRRVEYNVAKTQEMMEVLGLPKSLIQRLNPKCHGKGA